MTKKENEMGGKTSKPQNCSFLCKTVTCNDIFIIIRTACILFVQFQLPHDPRRKEEKRQPKKSTCCSLSCSANYRETTRAQPQAAISSCGCSDASYYIVTQSRSLWSHVRQPPVTCHEDVSCNKYRCCVSPEQAVKSHSRCIPRRILWLHPSNTYRCFSAVSKSMFSYWLSGSSDMRWLSRV
jgi:hypothetical protein